jgi:ubiquitin C-terminal hydrolase
MVDLIKFDESLVLSPIGLVNTTGYHCYWNSALQGLISCTQFLSQLENLLSEEKNDTIADYIISFIRNKITNMNLYKYYISSLQSIGKTKEQLKELITNQQCVGETITYFLELFEKKNKINRLFKHRYSHKLTCLDCNYIKEYISESITFEINTNNNLEKELYETTDTITDYKCENCLSCNEKIKINKLKMLPEILIILIKNYEWNHGGVMQSNDSDFPEYLYIKPLHYRAVAYIDYYGTVNSGHYISTCLRRVNNEINWYTFNDNYFTPTSFAPGIHTYMIIYSYIKNSL